MTRIFQGISTSPMQIQSIDGSVLKSTAKKFNIEKNPLQYPRQIADYASEKLSSKISRNLSQNLRRFSLSGAPYLHLKNCFDTSLAKETPDQVVPTNHNDWWSAAYMSLGITKLLNLIPISYMCENDGWLFVNLTTLSGQKILLNDKDITPTARVIEKSSKSMRGHTDAVSFPFPQEYEILNNQNISIPPPSPDFVILLGMRNPDNTPTYITPIAEVLNSLPSYVIEELYKPQFVIRSQGTFNIDHIMVNKPLLWDDSQRGRMIRFSHSKVTVDSELTKAREAYDFLCAEILKLKLPVCVEPGDILFINNRTALHGRAEVGKKAGGQSRWLIRTYANVRSTGGNLAQLGLNEHMLSC